MQSILEIMKEVPVLIGLLQNSPLVLLTLITVTAFAVVGLTVATLGKK